MPRELVIVTKRVKHMNEPLLRSLVTSMFGSVGE